ncbi:unnamed protein product [Tuber aestivum]|uniref:Uncharacterized protein n=1 Tax=Tuber aestivum TaxID=59557 RepID=A0A292PZ14_9PEZI|nr:unnamed protein product [Tuber aestivum]
MGIVRIWVIGVGALRARRIGGIMAEPSRMRFFRKTVGSSMLAGSGDSEDHFLIAMIGTKGISETIYLNDTDEQNISPFTAITKSLSSAAAGCWRHDIISIASRRLKRQVYQHYREKDPTPTASTATANTTPFHPPSLPNSQSGKMAEENVDFEATQQHLGDLAALEKEFDALEVQTLRVTYNSHLPLFQKRDAITSQIKGFWPLVIEQTSSMLNFDEFITPEDGHLLRSLRSMTLTRPDVDNEPRTIRLSFTFEENAFFEDTVLAKTFVFGKHGQMSSVPVGIKWKDGKDLTEGVSAAAVQAWEERKSGRRDGEGTKKLEELMKKGPSSFFNWFEWTGKHASLGEVKDEATDEDEDEEDNVGIVQTFPNGDELAIQLGEDIYPNAPKYFSQTFEEDDDDDEAEVDIESDSDIENGAILDVDVDRQGQKRNGVEDDGPSTKKVKK